jgi:2,3-bisphosphoglycerate-dependent phosphoglycerate mutase
MVPVEAGRSPGQLTAAMRSIEAAFLIGVEGTTEVWLVRHADCYDDLSDDADPPLSPRGREQAQRLSERLARLGYDAVHASPARRALETARSIAADIRVDERLVEIATELEDGHIEVSESPESTVERMRLAVEDAVTAHPGGRVVLVGHGVAIMAYLCDVLRLEFGTLRLLPYYTSVSVVRLLGERRMVGSLADVAHLESRL